MTFDLRHRRAFTLIELLLYVGAAGTVILAASVLLSLASSAKVKNQTIDEVYASGVASAMQRITDTIRNGGVVTGLAVGSGSNTITVTVPTSCNGNNQTVFTVASNKVTMTEGSCTPVDLTSSRITVTPPSGGYAFTNYGTASKASIRIQMTVAYAGESTRSELSFSRTFYATATARQ